MHRSPSTAERLDRAIDEISSGAGAPLAAAAAGVGVDDRPMVDAAARLRSSLPMPVVAGGFESRLGTRLSADGEPWRASLLAWAVRHPGRLLVTGAVGSAVGVGVTAAVLRSARRSPAHRWLHR
jgi:hypothetical protein